MQPAAKPALEAVLRHPAVWRVGQVPPHAPECLPTGHAGLDEALPEHGWPQGALTELLGNESGAGELSLLAPALAAISAKGLGIALAGPLFLPHARAWEAAGVRLARLLVIDAERTELLWAAEQALRSGECGAVLVWGQRAGNSLDYRALQRLHLAAGKGNALCVAYRDSSALASPSPAPLRIRLTAQANALQLHIAKCRGALRTRPVPVQIFPAHWQKKKEQAPSPSPQSVQPLLTAVAKSAIVVQSITAVPLAAATPLIRVTKQAAHTPPLFTKVAGPLVTPPMTALRPSDPVWARIA